MSNQIRKEDILDSDFSDYYELISDGTLSYLSGVSIVSTTSGTKQIVVSGLDLLYDRDFPVRTNDRITITGSIAAGNYTVNSIINSTTFDVVESIVTSSGGTVEFFYRPGGKNIGFDPSGVTLTTALNIQDAITDIANNASGISSTQHYLLRQLIHLSEEGGPFEGFSGAYQETLGGAFPTQIIWYTDSSKTSKIVEETITYNSNRTIATDQWKVYDTDGTTVLATATDVINYSGVFEINRTRTIS
jgi:hypothetical protein